MKPTKIVNAQQKKKEARKVKKEGGETVKSNVQSQHLSHF